VVIVGINDEPFRYGNNKCYICKVINKNCISSAIKEPGDQQLVNACYLYEREVNNENGD